MNINYLIRRAALFLAIGSVMFLLSCTEDEDPVDPPVASFTFTVDTATGGIVTFDNTSTGVGNTYSWDFGDGTSSTQDEPEKTYTADGTYTVMLTATNEGGNNSTTQDITITLVGEMTDETAPVITLTGDAEVEINVGDDYTDAGATAEDNVDGTITDNITVGGDAVNTDEAGTYVITYDVSDAAGNAADQVTRTVRVRFPSGLVMNGDFEGSSTDPWFVNFGEGTPPPVPVQKEGTNTFFIVNIETANAEQPFTVNLSQVVAIEQNKTYKLSFDASSSVDRGIIAGIGLNGGSFAGNSQTVNITTTEERYELDLRASFGEDGVDNRVLFDLAGEVGVVVINNVALEEVESTTVPPTTAPTAPPARDAADVISIYGEAYGTAIGLTNVDFDDPTNFEEVSIADNNVLKATMSGFLGANLGSVVDASGMTNFHMDFWIADGFVAGQIFNPKWSNHAGGMGETSSFEYTKAIGEAEVQSWVSIDIPITDFTTGDNTQRAELTQFLISVAGLVEEAYIDNVYFYNDGGGTGGGEGGCTETLVAATTLPLDFEGCETFLSSQNFGTGISSAIAANPSKDATNGSDFALKVDKVAGAEFFAGIQNVFPADANPLDFSDDNVLKLKVYSTKANTPFRFELILSDNPDGIGNPAPVFATVADANVWTEVEIDFNPANFPAGGTANTYNQLVIKPDNDQSDSPITADGTYYIDDISVGAATETGTPGEYCDRQVKHFGGNAGSEALLTIESVDRADGFAALKFTIATDPTNNMVPDLIVVNSLEGSPGLEALDTSVAGEVSIEAFWPGGNPANDETLFQVLWSFEGDDGNWQLFETVGDERVSVDASCSE